MTPLNSELQPNERALAIYREFQAKIYKDADRLFAYLMIGQWCFGIFCAFVISPLRWEGSVSDTHIHVWAAIFLGGALTFFPVLLAFLYPGKTVTRHVIAFSQMMMSALLIHLMAGRLETHFHVFGSLAFLAFYRDWRVLITGTIVVALDHYFRGVYWPQSVYGIPVASQWRWLEHAGWVLFENIFLTISCLKGCNELRSISIRQADLEVTNAALDSRTQELTESNRELEQFAQVAAHDLKSPLRSVATNCLLFEESCGNELNPEAKVYARNAVEGARAMNNVIDDILEYSRVGREVSLREPIPLNQVAHSVLSNLEAVISQKNATVTLDSLPTLKGNLSLLTRLMQNLIENAIKFSDKSQPKIHISAHKNGSEWLISVQDNGIGIDPQYFGRIFEMFKRLHSSSEYPGTGAGLSICKKIVEKHGGKIWVESKPGVGSTFIFSLGANVNLRESVETADSAAHQSRMRA